MKYIYSKRLLPFLLIFLFIKGYAGEMVYKASDIPSDLQKNAKAVIRNSEVIMDIDQDGVLEKHKLAITILNKNGYNLSIFREFYDPFVSLKDIEIKTFDGEGNKIKTYSGFDIKDYSAINGFSLYEDNRMKYLDPECRKYPFTITFSFKRKLKSLMILHQWEVYPDYNCSVEKSSLIINISGDATIRFVEKNLPIKSSSTEKKGIKTITWELTNLPAFSQEDFEAPASEYLPEVFLSTNNFEIKNSKGSFKTWDDFGKWVLELNKNRDTLSLQTVQYLNDMTKNLSPREKAAKIYQYMQSKTRYVSIQIGIGGWQPFDALTVDRLSYGDCKALANYTYALLKAVGIKSNYTLIKAGSNAEDVIADFPSSNFNHAILTVPLNNDTIFLECTSPYSPFGHLGSFTDNRYALLVDKDKTHLIRTRNYKCDENVINSKVSVYLNQQGSGTANIKTCYSGVYFDDIKRLSVESDDDIKKELYSSLNISNFIINHFSFNQPDINKPFISNNIDVSLEGYATAMGKKLIVPLCLLNKITEIPNITDKRKSDILIKRYKTVVDSIEYNIPDGFEIEKVPSAVNMSSRFGSYQSKCLVIGNKLLFIRTFKLIPGRFAPTDSKEFDNFYIGVSTADLAKFTMVKK